jgi:acyl-CoA dehydrogenase
MCKLYCSEMVGRVADRAVQIHGGMGLVQGYPIERMYRDVRHYRWARAHPKYNVC